MKFIVILLFMVAPVVRADAVLDWNAIAAQSIAAAGRPGPSTIIDFAVVHAAMHDAAQAYDKTYAPYAVDIDGATGSPAAAIAKATHDVLTNRFPSQSATIIAALAGYLTANNIPVNDPGLNAGAQVAAAINTLRANDGAFPAPSPVFVGANVVGLWRPTPSLLPGAPPSSSPMAAPWLGDVTPFVVLSAEQFAAPAPHALKSGLYAKDYNEVKAFGSLTGSQRTADQTQIAYFWADNFPIQMNRTLRGIAEAYVPNSGDRARMFALVWLTAGDGLITAWASKLQYPTWRPITAIREGDADGNHKTLADQTWQPLINTPNYPDHCSGANSFVSGAMQMLKLFFHTDKVTFTITSLNANANPSARTYTRFSEAALQVVEARIFQGIHFRTADRDGRRLGRGVAHWIYNNALRPLNEGFAGEQEPEVAD